MSDPTGPGGVGTAQAERPSARTARVGDSGSPVGSPLTIVLAVIAVVVGFLIFRTIDSGGGSGTAGLPVDTSTITVAGGTTPTDGTTATTVAGATTTVASVETRTGATVVVINAGEVSQSAGALTELLTERGYTTVDGVSDADDEQSSTTVVQFLDGTGNPAVEAVARTLAADLGGVDVEAVTTAPAVSSGDSVGAATVFVLLGTDKANQPLAPAAPTSPSAPSVQTPAPTTGAG
jgi:hypothetical protein